MLLLFFPIFISALFLILHVIVVLILNVDQSGKKENKTVFLHWLPRDLFSTLFLTPVTLAFLIIMNLANFSPPEGYCADFSFQKCYFIHISSQVPYIKRDYHHLSPSIT